MIPIRPSHQSLIAIPSSNSSLEALHKKVERAWNSARATFHQAVDKVSQLTLAVVSCFWPRVEALYWRVSTLYHTVKGNWDREQAEKKLANLKVKHHAATYQIRKHAQQKQETQSLIQENQQLRSHNQQLLEASQFQGRALSDSSLQQQKLEQTHQHLLSHNQQLLQERGNLLQENDQLKQERLKSLQAFQHLHLQLTQEQQKNSDLEAQLASQKQILSKTAQATQNPDPLLTLLLQQISDAQEKLTLSKQNLPRHSSSAIPLQSLQRILNTLTTHLRTTPSTLKCQPLIAPLFPTEGD